MMTLKEELPVYGQNYVDVWVLFRNLLADTRVTQILAKYCYEVLEIFYSKELRIDI